jgi:hypothetical protein
MLSITKFQLFSLLTTNGTAWATVLGHPHAIVDSIQREDGSGNCFNVVLKSCNGTHRHTVFVKTVD